MQFMERLYSSQLLDGAAGELAKLPGIGRKSALRLALHVLRMDELAVDKLAESLTRLRHDARRCRVCHNISDEELCSICANPMRDGRIVCVVENFQDVLAIEATGQFRGLYHVLGGVISPMDGMAPSDLEIESLVERVGKGDIDELIFALSATMEGDTTCFYLSRRLADYPQLKLSVLARGLSVNDELQYADEATLGRSIINRIPFGS